MPLSSFFRSALGYESSSKRNGPSSRWPGVVEGIELAEPVVASSTRSFLLVASICILDRRCSGAARNPGASWRISPRPGGIKLVGARGHRVLDDGIELVAHPQGQAQYDIARARVAHT